jgi:hypothetical protein
MRRPVEFSPGGFLLIAISGAGGNERIVIGDWIFVISESCLPELWRKRE